MYLCVGKSKEPCKAVLSGMKNEHPKHSVSKNVGWKYPPAGAVLQGSTIEKV